MSTRPLHPNEPLPFYSTAELLLGVCHITYGAAKRAPRRRYGACHPALKGLLIEKKTTPVIAKYLKVPQDTVKRWISRDPELKALSAKRSNTGKFNQYPRAQA